MCVLFFDFIFLSVNLKWERSNYTVNEAVGEVEVCIEVESSVNRNITLNISYWDESACTFYTKL